MTRPRRALATTAAALVLLTACGTAGGTNRTATEPRTGDWQSVLDDARGQTVRWYMYGGDDALNRFVSGVLADRLASYDVAVEQVKITDTVDAVNKVLAEKQAGRDAGGSVDLVWINGENFATGKQADLWFCGYDRRLPNAGHVDFDAAAVTQDFGVPVEGCESVWQNASSALVYDSASLTAADVESVTSLFEWAERNPGRFTYPAPPDFTGSMAVRTFLYDTAGGPEQLDGVEVDEDAYAPVARALWRRLADVAPSLWRAGDTYPSSQSDVERLYASGEVDAFFTYGPGAVGRQVADGVFPESTRETVPDVGNIANNSFVAIPYNSSNKAGAMVLANELLHPRTQLALFEATGAYPAIDLETVPPRLRRAFDAVDLGPSVLALDQLRASSRPELAAAYVTRIEADWTRNVLQR